MPFLVFSQMFQKLVKYIIPVYLLIFLLQVRSVAQTFDWKAGYYGFFDNREYFNRFTSDQTIFGSRIFAEAGFSINESNHFSVGLNALYEFGTKNHLKTPDIIFYYNATKEPFNFYLGSFPRWKLINQPLFLLTDTLNYYRPNVEGMFLSFRKKWGYHSLWLDWTSRQTNTTRETFLIGGTGHFDAGVFFYEHNFMMYHFAAPSIPIPEDHLRDNGGLTAVLGVNLSSRLPVDSLTFSSGIALSYDRLRNVYDFRFPVGWYSELYLGYKGFGIHGTFYIGDPQTVLYGDRFYGSKSYQRLDFYYSGIRSSFIEGKIRFSVHFVPGVIDYSQMLVIYVSLDGHRQINRKF